VKKSQYRLTNRREHVAQMVRLDKVEENLLFIEQQVNAAACPVPSAPNRLKSTRGPKPLTDEKLRQRYIISETGTSLKFSQFLQQNASEPAIQASFYISTPLGKTSDQELCPEFSPYGSRPHPMSPPQHRE
jgi:hypothetical protein